MDNRDPVYVGNAIISLKQATGWSIVACADFVNAEATHVLVKTIADHNRKRTLDSAFGSSFDALTTNGHHVPQNSTLAKCPVLECRCQYHEEGTYHSNPECPFFID